MTLDSCAFVSIFPLFCHSKRFLSSIILANNILNFPVFIVKLLLMSQPFCCFWADKEMQRDSKRMVHFPVLLPRDSNPLYSRECQNILLFSVDDDFRGVLQNLMFSLCVPGRFGEYLRFYSRFLHSENGNMLRRKLGTIYPELKYERLIVSWQRGTLSLK